VVTVAHRGGKWVSVCGEMTSDPHAVPLLVGLGCDCLSISPRMFLRVKETVRGLRHAAMVRLVAKALTCADSEEIRRLMREQGL
jgi:phosphoenolpyruvate-protein kinase (PTS system EI component)